MMKIIISGSLFMKNTPRAAKMALNVLKAVMGFIISRILKMEKFD